MFSDIINPDLYDVLGEPPEQQIQFHNSSCFDLYLIRVIEVFAEGRAILDDGKKQNFSLFTGISWLSNKYQDEARATSLDQSCDALNIWLKESKPISFWCGEMQTQCDLELDRQNMISFAANICKHHLLRLDQLLGKLRRLLDKYNYRVGKKLRTLRTRRGLTVRQSSNLLDINHSHITKIETGENIPSLKLALKIADLFDISIDQLARDDLEID